MIPEIDLEGTPFDEALDKVRKLSPVPIVVHWPMLASAGLDAKTPVIFRARDVTLGRVLSELVKALNLASASAVYVAANDLILISAHQETALLEVSVRSYDVQDLLRPPADPWACREFANPTETDVAYITAFPQPVSREESLRRLILQTVSRDMWRETGGQIGSIRSFSGRMIVTQTWENHRQIAELLADLRKPPAPATPAPPTTDLKLWDNRLKKYVSTDDSIGEAALRRRIPEVRFDHEPLDEAVMMLADQAHANVIVDWGALKLAKVDEQTPVSVRLHDVMLVEALHGLLTAAGGGQLYFSPEGGLVIVGPQGDQRVTVTRVYDLRGWLAAVMGPPPAQAPKSRAEFDAWANQRGMRMDQLIRVIWETVAPDSWQETGGLIGRIRELDDELVVTQSWENQDRVADLLAAIRADPSRLRLTATTAPTS